MKKALVITVTVIALVAVTAGMATAAGQFKTPAKTLAGGSVAIRIAGGKVFVGRAQVIKPDVSTSNGVIHVVDKVLIPGTK